MFKDLMSKYSQSKHVTRPDKITVAMLIQPFTPPQSGTFPQCGINKVFLLLLHQLSFMCISFRHAEQLPETFSNCGAEANVD